MQLNAVRVTSPKPPLDLCVSTLHLKIFFFRLQTAQHVSFRQLLFAFAPDKFLLVSSVLSLLFSVLLFLPQSSLNTLIPPSLLRALTVDLTQLALMRV